MSLASYATLVQRWWPGSMLVNIERLQGGVSADVSRLDLKQASGSHLSVVLRAHGESHSGHPAQTEFDLLQALFVKGLPVAQPLAVDETKSLLPNDYLVLTFIGGSSLIESPDHAAYIERAAEMLARIHQTPVEGLPELPARREPLPEVFDYWPQGPEWEELKTHLQHASFAPFSGKTVLCHGDFWPENILWQEGRITGVLDWEDAALGDPLSDLACSRLEFRYRFGVSGMQRFTEAYAAKRPFEVERLALWQIYVAAAAQCFMGEWGLPADQEAHMLKTALQAIREAEEALTSGAPLI